MKCCMSVISNVCKHCVCLWLLCSSHLIQYLHFAHTHDTHINVVKLFPLFSVKLTFNEWPFAAFGEDTVNHKVMAGPSDRAMSQMKRAPSALRDKGYKVTSSDYKTVSKMLTTGKLSEYDMTTLATRIQNSWSNMFYSPSVAEVRCAAALAATGHLTSVDFKEPDVLKDFPQESHL